MGSSLDDDDVRERAPMPSSLYKRGPRCILLRGFRTSQRGSSTLHRARVRRASCCWRCWARRRNCSAASGSSSRARRFVRPIHGHLSVVKTGWLRSRARHWLHRLFGRRGWQGLGAWRADLPGGAVDHTTSGFPRRPAGRHGRASAVVVARFAAGGTGGLGLLSAASSPRRSSWEMDRHSSRPRGESGRCWPRLRWVPESTGTWGTAR